ncbi:hypothetical protein V1520DRAFT_351050 [Lipomyces starkeyi]|uniref:DUF1593 domain-containing protein n=1 Tax=Lipomyces starkeyi NRRL Y-11557 TaxID=675824 RepID=A0A1E3PU51_LIPST|nr:hypothetical protein LIPSTDRAFT_76729 [Lipomyces starkeyi NRRL Y-11557]
MGARLYTVFGFINLLMHAVAFTFSAPPMPLPPNVYVLTDIANEPDDAQSLIRLFLYSNEINILGIAASTSVWLNTTTRVDQIYDIIDKYSEVQETLRVHSKNYPSASILRSLVTSGSSAYGTDVFAEEPSEAVSHLIMTIDSIPSGDSIWVQIWGGSTILAHALHKVSKSRDAAAVDDFVSKVRVYAISDQDNSGPWIRANFPRLFYIVSVHGWNLYGLATWAGISGEHRYNFDKGGPDSLLVSPHWIKENVQIGHLGEAYPDVMFIMEGDTPSLLYVIPNGLGSLDHPEYGSWGGRYVAVDESGFVKNYVDAADRVLVNDKMFRSNQATIWRWRPAFQADFAARIQWSVQSSFSGANHEPTVVVNGSSSISPITISLCNQEEDVILDASASSDPDGDDLDFKWTQYFESTATRWIAESEVKSLNITESKRGIVKFRVPSLEQCSQGDHRSVPVRTFHVILEVTDSGSPRLTRYRRIIIERANRDCIFAHDEL